jgi:AhpD family alkylhydroperoxidase
VIKYIQPVKPSSAQGLVADVYMQIKEDFGKIAEPFLMHSPIPELLAGAWMVCRETELVGQVPREIKEAVAAAISKTNQCPYCVDAHTIMLTASGEKKTAQAISNEQYNSIPDGKMRLIVEWALETTTPTSPTLRSPPFLKQEAPEIIGTAVFYHYMNRMAKVLLSDTPLPSNQSWLKSFLKQMASRMFSRAINRPKNTGESLQFLPKADLPNDLRWAKPAPNIAAAYASFAAAIEKVGDYVLPPAVRAYIQEEVDVWHGKTSELSLAWSEDEISKLDAATQAAADLALLTAIAPHEIDKNAVLTFKKYFPQDDKLVGTLAWASFTAARKISTWIQTPPV